MRNRFDVVVKMMMLCLSLTLFRARDGKKDVDCNVVYLGRQAGTTILNYHRQQRLNVPSSWSLPSTEKEKK
jgi:hypothetical protein